MDTNRGIAIHLEITVPGHTEEATMITESMTTMGHIMTTQAMIEIIMTVMLNHTLSTMRKTSPSMNIESIENLHTTEGGVMTAAIIKKHITMVATSEDVENLHDIGAVSQRHRIRNLLQSLLRPISMTFI